MSTPNEVYRKDLVSAMLVTELPECTQYWPLQDNWKTEWERGVQVPAKAKQKKAKVFELESVPQPPIEVPRERARYSLDNLDCAWLDSANQHRQAAQLPSLTENDLEKIIDDFETQANSTIRQKCVNKKATSLEDNSVCDVCRSPHGEDGNELVFCDGCDICVHQHCYGISKLPPDTQKWFCRPCEDNIKPRCYLCGQFGGALTRAIGWEKLGMVEAPWVHIQCALWIPEVTMTKPDKMSDPDISQIPESRRSLRCYVCSTQVGCVQCNVKKCFKAYHVTCGVRNSQSVRMEHKNGQVNLISNCDKHSDQKSDEIRKRRISIDQEIDEQRRVLEENFFTLVSLEHAAKRLVHYSQDTLDWVFEYWRLKRRSNLNQQLVEEDSGEPEAATAEQRYRRITQLRTDLEKSRNLLCLIMKRERVKRQILRCDREIKLKEMKFLGSKVQLSDWTKSELSLNSNDLDDSRDGKTEADDAAQFLEDLDFDRPKSPKQPTRVPKPLPKAAVINSIKKKRPSQDDQGKIEATVAFNEDIKADVKAEVDLSQNILNPLPEKSRCSVSPRSPSPVPESTGGIIVPISTGTEVKPVPVPVSTVSQPIVPNARVQVRVPGRAQTQSRASIPVTPTNPIPVPVGQPIQVKNHVQRMKVHGNFHVHTRPFRGNTGITRLNGPIRTPIGAPRPNGPLTANFEGKTVIGTKTVGGQQQQITMDNAQLQRNIRPNPPNSLNAPTVRREPPPNLVVSTKMVGGKQVQLVTPNMGTKKGSFRFVRPQGVPVSGARVTVSTAGGIRGPIRPMGARVMAPPSQIPNNRTVHTGSNQSSVSQNSQNQIQPRLPVHVRTAVGGANEKNLPKPVANQSSGNPSTKTPGIIKLGPLTKNVKDENKDKPEEPSEEDVSHRQLAEKFLGVKDSSRKINRKNSEVEINKATKRLLDISKPNESPKPQEKKKNKGLSFGGLFNKKKSDKPEMDSKKSAFMEKMLKSINKTAQPTKKAPKMSPFMARKKAEKEKMSKKPEKVEKEERPEVAPVLEKPEVPVVPKPQEPKKFAKVTNEMGNESDSKEPAKLDTTTQQVKPRRETRKTSKPEISKPEPKSLRSLRSKAVEPVLAPIIDPIVPKPTKPDPVQETPKPEVQESNSSKTPEFQKRKLSVDGEGVVKDCKVNLEKLTNEQIRQFSPPPEEPANLISESSEIINPAEHSTNFVPIDKSESSGEIKISMHSDKTSTTAPVPAETENIESSEPVKPVTGVEEQKNLLTKPSKSFVDQNKPELPEPIQAQEPVTNMAKSSELEISNESVISRPEVNAQDSKEDPIKPPMISTVEKRKNPEPISIEEPPVKMAKASDSAEARMEKNRSPDSEVQVSSAQSISSDVKTPIPVSEPVSQPKVDLISEATVEPVNALDFLSDSVLPVSSKSSLPVEAVPEPAILGDPEPIKDVASLLPTQREPVPIQKVKVDDQIQSTEPVKDDDDDIPLDALVAPAEPVQSVCSNEINSLLTGVCAEKPVTSSLQTVASSNDELISTGISPAPDMQNLVNNFSSSVPVSLPEPDPIPVPVPSEPIENNLAGASEDNPLDLIFGGGKTTPENSGTIFDPSDIFGNNEPVQNPLDEILGFQGSTVPPVPIPSGPVTMLPNQPPIPPMGSSGVISGPNSISPVDGIVSMTGSSKSTTSPVEGLEDLFDDISKEVGKHHAPNLINSQFSGLPDFSAGGNPLSHQNANQNSLAGLFGNNLPFPSTAIPGVKSEPPLDPSKISLFDKMSNFPANLLATQNPEKSKLSRPDSAISRLLDTKPEPIQKMAKDLLLQKRPGPGRPRKNPIEPPREPKKRGPKPKNKNKIPTSDTATLAELLKSSSNMLPGAPNTNGPTGAGLFSQNLLAQQLAMANQASQENLGGNNIFNKVIAQMMMNQQMNPKAPTPEDIQRQAKMLLEKTKLGSTLPQPAVPSTAQNLQSLLSSTSSNLQNNPFWGGLRNSFSTEGVKNDILAKSEAIEPIQTSTLSSLIDRTPGISSVKSENFAEKPKIGEKRKGPGRPKGSVNREKTVEGTLEKIRKARKVAHEPLSIIPPISPPIGLKKEHKVIHSPNVREITVLETPSGTLTLTPTKKMAKELSAKKRKGQIGSAEKPKKRAKRSKSPNFPPSNHVKTGKGGLPKTAYKGRLPKLKFSRNQSSSDLSDGKWRLDYVFESKIPDSEIDCTPLLDRSSKNREPEKMPKRRGSAAEFGPKMTPPPLQRAPGTPGGSSCDLGAPQNLGSGAGTSHVARILPTLSPAPSSNSSVDHTVDLKSPASVGSKVVNQEPVRLKIRLSRNNNRPLASSTLQGQLRSTPRKAKSQVKYTVDSWWDDS